MFRLKSTDYPARVWWLLVPLLLLIAALAARSINADAIWFDEYWSLYQSGGAHYGPLSPLDIWQRVADTSVWPPAYHLTLAAWEAAAGSTPFAGRWLALLFGLLTVAFTYRLGRDLFRSEWVGIGAAVAMGGSAYFVNYLHELRGYTLYTLVVAFGVWAYWRAITVKRPTWRNYAALLVGLTGLLYIHFFAALVFIALGLYHLLFVAKTRRWWLITLMAVIAGVLFLPWVRQALRDLDYAQTGDAFRLRALSAGEVLTGLVAAFGNGSVALLAFVMAFALTLRGRAVRLVWLWLLVVLVGGLLVNEALRILTEVRYLLALWPALALLFGAGIEQIAGRATHASPLHRLNGATLILVLWLAAGVWNSIDPVFGDNTRKGAFTDLPMRELRATLAERAQADDAIALERPDHVWALEPVYDYYTHGLAGRYAIMELLLGRQEDDEYYWQVKAFLLDAPRVWIAIDNTLPPNFRLAEFERVLADDGYDDCGRVFDLPTMSLDLYARQPENDSELVFTNMDTTITTMTLLEPLPQSVRRDLPVLFGLNVSEDTPANTYSVALHVVPEGETTPADQIDFPLSDAGADAGFKCDNIVIDLDSTLPAGRYELRALIYDWQSGQRLSVDGGDAVSLGTFEITR